MSDKQTPSSEPDLDAEREVDLGRVGRVLLAHWWLPVGGLIVGVAIGFMLSLGGARVFKAEALVSLGTPFTPGGAALPGQVNPRQITEIINSESALRTAAAVARLKPGDVRGKVSLRIVATGLPGKSLVGPQLVGISVQGSRPRRVADAANQLAKIAINRTAPYVNAQISTLEEQLRTKAVQLESLATRIDLLQKQVDAPGLAPLDRLTLVSYLDNAEQRRAALLDAQALTQQQLLLAKEVESATILQRASAVEKSGRSRHNSMAVGGLIGLILGALAALLWDWGAARTGRSPAAA